MKDHLTLHCNMQHDGQVRKFTGEPYITHPIAIAKVVAEITDDCEMI